MGAVNRHHTDGSLGQWRKTPLWVAGEAGLELRKARPSQRVWQPRAMAGNAIVGGQGKLGWNYGKARPPQRVWYSRAMAGNAIVGGRGGRGGITERLGPRNGLGSLGQWRETPLWVAGGWVGITERLGPGLREPHCEHRHAACAARGDVSPHGRGRFPGQSPSQGPPRPCCWSGRRPDGKISQK